MGRLLIVMVPLTLGYIERRLTEHKHSRSAYWMQNRLINCLQLLLLWLPCYDELQPWTVSEINPFSFLGVFIMATGKVYGQTISVYSFSISSIQSRQHCFKEASFCLINFSLKFLLNICNLKNTNDLIISLCKDLNNFK